MRALHFTGQDEGDVRAALVQVRDEKRHAGSGGGESGLGGRPQYEDRDASVGGVRLTERERERNQREGERREGERYTLMEVAQQLSWERLEDGGIRYSDKAKDRDSNSRNTCRQTD